MPPRAGAEEFDHDEVVVAVDHQAADAIALAVEHAPGIRHVIELEEIAAQVRRFADLAREPRGIDRDVRVGLEHAQGDARMAVVETAPDPGSVHTRDVDDAARLGPLRGLFDQPLEDPRVGGMPGVLEADGGNGVGHGGMLTSG